MGVLDDAIREHLDLKRRRGADPAEIERLEREALGPVHREPSAFSAEGGLQPQSMTLAEQPDSHLDAATEYIDLGAEHRYHDDLAHDRDDGVGPADHPPGFPSPDYGDPEFGGFSTTETPPTGGMDMEPSAPTFTEDASAEPRGRRRGLFARFGHHEDPDAFERGPVQDLPDEDDPFAEPHPSDAHDAFSDHDLAGAGDASPVQPDAHQPPPLRIGSDPEPELSQTVEYDVEHHFREEDAAPGPRPEDIFPDTETELAEDAEGADDPLEETPEFLADTPDHDRLWFEQKPPPDFHFDS
jgi:hypothetical protein